MKDAQIVKPSLKHIPQLASTLRKADLEEIKAFSGDSPTKALLRGLHTSRRAFSILNGDSECIGMFGTCDYAYNDCPVKVGLIWLLGSDELVEDYGYTFARQSKECLKRVSKGYDLLFNYTHINNEPHHRWLKWLGFTFISKENDFYHFLKIIKD